MRLGTKPACDNSMRELMEHKRQPTNHCGYQQTNHETKGQEILRASLQNRVGERGTSAGLQKLKIIVRFTLENALVGNAEDITHVNLLLSILYEVSTNASVPL